MKIVELAETLKIVAESVKNHGNRAGKCDFSQIRARNPSRALALITAVGTLARAKHLLLRLRYCFSRNETSSVMCVGLVRSHARSNVAI